MQNSAITSSLDTVQLHRQLDFPTENCTSLQCTVFSVYITQWLLKCCAITMNISISPEQVKVLHSEAGKPLDYVDQKFSYDVEVEVTENMSFCNTALKQKIIFWLRAQLC